MAQVKEKNKTKKKLKKPRLYKVIMHNDNYTTMDFVVEILRNVFGKSEFEAHEIMLKIHNSGLGICGVYPYDIAYTKTEIVHYLADKNKFPLKCTIEPDNI